MIRCRYHFRIRSFARTTSKYHLKPIHPLQRKWYLKYYACLGRATIPGKAVSIATKGYVSTRERIFAISSCTLQPTRFESPAYRFHIEMYV